MAEYIELCFRLGFFLTTPCNICLSAYSHLKMSMLNILICGVKEVDDLIDEADGVISIMNPGYTIYAPRSIASRESENRYSVLRFEFDDVWHECYKLGMEIVTPEIIESAISFAYDFVESFGDEATLLVHCHEGISRSAAIAIAIYTSLYEDAQDAVTRVSHQRPQAIPNIEVIRLTDDLLDMQGELYDAVAETFYR